MRMRPFLHIISPFLCAVLAVGAAPIATDILRALADLGHERYAVREGASERLMKLAESSHEAVLAECIQVYRQTKDFEVKERLKEVMAVVVDRYLYRAPRGYLGVMIQHVDVQGEGRLVIRDRVMPSGSVWVSQVTEETPAQKAGLQPNDFIIEVDGKPWKSGPSAFTKYVQSKHPGDRLNLSVLRGTSTNVVETLLGELPKSEVEKLFPKEGSQEFFKVWLKERLEANPAFLPDR